mmetsp:Transcript_8544/g.22867  ORF Transcript_8544/g.22867 Transcript_8544/m.22867 type:complete len:223 (-) Transcript_8544:2412-3080(-)
MCDCEREEGGEEEDEFTPTTCIPAFLFAPPPLSLLAALRLSMLRSMIGDDPTLLLLVVFCCCLSTATLPCPNTSKPALLVGEVTSLSSSLLVSFLSPPCFSSFVAPALSTCMRKLLNTPLSRGANMRFEMGEEELCASPFPFCFFPPSFSFFFSSPSREREGGEGGSSSDVILVSDPNRSSSSPSSDSVRSTLPVLSLSELDSCPSIAFPTRSSTVNAASSS